MMSWKPIDRAASVAAACIALALMGHSSPAAGLVINADYTPLQSHPEAVATLKKLVASYEEFFTDNVTVSVQFASDPTGGLAESSTEVHVASYVDFRNALESRRTTHRDNLAFMSSVPNQSHNPVLPNRLDIILSRPNARVLGLSVGSMGYDSIITFNLTEHNLSRTGPQISGYFDLHDSATHELNEVLGLGSGLDLPTNFPTQTSTAQDLFRYEGPGMRSYKNPTAVPYLSYNAGVNHWVDFNQDHCGPFNLDPNAADCGDWYSGFGTGNTPRQQDAYGTAGVQLDWDYVAFGNLDVIGWTLVPEPSTGLLLATGLLGLAIRRRTH